MAYAARLPRTKLTQAEAKGYFVYYGTCKAKCLQANMHVHTQTYANLCGGKVYAKLMQTFAVEANKSARTSRVGLSSYFAAYSATIPQSYGKRCRILLEKGKTSSHLRVGCPASSHFPAVRPTSERAHQEDRAACPMHHVSYAILGLCLSRLLCLVGLLVEVNGHSNLRSCRSHETIYVSNGQVLHYTAGHTHRPLHGHPCAVVHGVGGCSGAPCGRL